MRSPSSCRSPMPPAAVRSWGPPLHNWGFPLLRYRTGDQVLVGSRTACPCGRAFPLVDAIDGRLEDIVRTRDGRPIPLASRLLNDLVGVRESQFVQERQGVFAVLLVPAGGFDLGRLTAQLETALERLMGPGQVLRVEPVDSLVRAASGKKRAVAVEG